MEHRVLGGIVIVAVFARVVSALLQGNETAPLPGIYDQISYDTLARRLLAGNGFTFPTAWWPYTRPDEPTAHWSYLYSIYLAVVYAVAGTHPIVPRLIQAVIAGVLQPWIAWRISRRLFGVPAGLAAGGLTAVYGYFVYYAGALMTETFTILAVLWVLDVATSMVQTPANPIARLSDKSRLIHQAAKPWLLLGVALGSAILLRQVIAIFLPVLFVWLLWAMRKRETVSAEEARGSREWPAARGILVTVIIVAAMIAPWTLRNFWDFGRFVPLNTNAGYAFFWANHPIYGTDFVPLLPDGMYQHLVPEELRELNEAALDQALLGEGLRFVVEDPLRYARLSLSRIDDYFEFRPSAESDPYSNVARVLSFGIYLPFILYGLFLTVFRQRQVLISEQRSPLVLLYLFICVYSVIHLMSWTLIRYRLPVDAVLMIFAALPVSTLALSLTRLILLRPSTDEGLQT